MTTNQIAFLRRQQNLTQMRLAEMVGMQKSTLNRIENGKTVKFDKYRDKLAKALKCSPEDLDGDDDSPTFFPITGIVRHKTFIQKIDHKNAAKGPVIEGLPESTEIVQIKTADLFGYHRRDDMLYFDSKPQPSEKKFLDRECIVHLDSVSRGEWLLAWVSKANSRGRYHLHMPHAQMLLDQKIRAVHPILRIRKS